MGDKETERRRKRDIDNRKSKIIHLNPECEAFALRLASANAQQPLLSAL